MSLLESSPIVANEAEADALLSKISGQTPEESTPPAPMQATDDVNKELAKTEIEKAEPTDPLHKILWKGQEKEMPLSKIISYAQQAYAYNEKSSALKAEQALLTKDKEKFKEIEQKMAQYQAIEDYNKKDPAWWKWVQENYQKKMGEDPSNQITQHPVVKELMDKVNGISEKLTTSEEREKLLKQATQDTELDTEVNSFIAAHPELEWSKLDENGHNLENRILQHGLNNQIASFRASARDYLFDELIKRHEVKAKEQVGKQIQKVNKLGLGPIKDEPTRKINPVQNLRSKSWDEIGDEAKKELSGR